MRISNFKCNFEREKLRSPFGFKGGYLSELWQSVVLLEDEKNNSGLGLGTQSTLWSDSEIFSNNPEASGNSMMFLITSQACKLAQGLEWNSPIELMDKILPELYEYAKGISGKADLRLTFVLNALVALDNAAWQLYACRNQIKDFDGMVPDKLKASLPCRHNKLALVPLITYGMSEADIMELLSGGCFLPKIKIGSNPEGDNNPEKMLVWDKQRLDQIHQLAKDIKTPYTETGHIAYYIDANGRYPNKELFREFLDHADKTGALERISILEEPFPETFKEDVSDLPVRLAADESAHSDIDALERIKLGYSAIALKPIAKTMSMTLKILQEASEHQIPCFCADLTVNPVMVEWNKNVAARIEALPGIKIGVVESNGAQNYLNWSKMQSYHPFPDAKWANPKDGIFSLDDDFYQQSGGIFEISEHYQKLVNN
jgi:L-alanine-DL-glutamate epimerase-like enolase superfamily enzyme